MKSEQRHGKRYRGRLARRMSAVVALALGTALLATPASAAGTRPEARTVQQVRTVTAAGPAVAAEAGTRSEAGPVTRDRRADAGDQVLAKEKKKKKKGFFKKLGIALLIILIVVIILVIVAIWLIVHFVRKAFRRRRS
ncbi:MULTISPECIES: hypothetical protein [Streptomyces]|uniref:hypothetical protein n=1 Tax=Streptomyces TaxID=1883 RepID=UPI00163CE7FE|nr:MULTISPECIES: hypothetical protein [Streptomyces]MBC2874349.1 hypothetical protein [Streptomyces sp. TYQ1024]UBI40382.1 hypothetical protein K7I03_30645 [Streptomyces mobaraensis]UKW32964.1 hypothetical protein MCU78_30565 [Streptomyces sp. TYQ1024]